MKVAVLKVLRERERDPAAAAATTTTTTTTTTTLATATLTTALAADATTAVPLLPFKQLRTSVEELLGEKFASEKRDIAEELQSTLQYLLKKQKIICDKTSNDGTAAYALKRGPSSDKTDDNGEDNSSGRKRSLDADDSTAAAADEKKKRQQSKRQKNSHADSTVESSSSSNISSSSSGNWDSRYVELWKNGEKHWREKSFDAEYLRLNPHRITRLFCGNLNKNITADELKERLPGISHIKWITDKQTGEFYGSSFIELKDPAAAAFAVMQDQSKFLGRPLKLYYCPPRPGDKWPPASSTTTGGTGTAAFNATTGATTSTTGTTATGAEMQQQPPRRQKSEKPVGSRKLFMGNLSYNIDDECVVDFFKDCGSVVGLRWLTHQSSGEFRGCGFIEFDSTEAADAAMALDDKELLGRNIRLDWTT